MFRLKKWQLFLILLMVSVISGALCEMLIAGVEYNFIPMLYHRLLFTAKAINPAYYNYFGAAFIGLQGGGSLGFLSGLLILSAGLLFLPKLLYAKHSLISLAIFFLIYLFGSLIYLMYASHQHWLGVTEENLIEKQASWIMNRSALIYIAATPAMIYLFKTGSDQFFQQNKDIRN